MGILVRTIIEMLGAPKEHIEQTLKDYVEDLKEDYNIIKADFESAAPVDRFFSAFVELEIDFKQMDNLIAFCFKSMPSSIEVLEPDKISMTNRQLAGYLNDLQSRLHEQDAKIKTLQAKGSLVDVNATQLLQNFIVYVLNQGPKTLAEVSREIGVPEDEVRPFLDKLLEAKRINVEGDIYKV